MFKKTVTAAALVLASFTFSPSPAAAAISQQITVNENYQQVYRRLVHASQCINTNWAGQIFHKGTALRTALYSDLGLGEFDVQGFYNVTVQKAGASKTVVTFNHRHRHLNARNTVAKWAHVAQGGQHDRKYLCR